MDASRHPVVIEYAVQECFKHKTPGTAAKTTKSKLAGSGNLFIGGGQDIVEIDERVLESEVWKRMAFRALAAASKMKPGFESYALEGTLQEFGQKVTPKNLKLLDEAISLSNG